MFEAKHGTGDQGDIAIDDIVAKPGRCGDPGKMYFQVLNERSLIYCSIKY